MAQPVRTPEMATLHREGCEDLPAQIVQDGDSITIASCWEFNDDEIEQIIRTRHIWLNVMGRAHPPVAITVDPPFAALVDVK